MQTNITIHTGKKSVSFSAPGRLKTFDRKMDNFYSSYPMWKGFKIKTVNGGSVFLSKKTILNSIIIANESER